jgi:uncharacterized protein (DUF1330 family)
MKRYLVAVILWVHRGFEEEFREFERLSLNIAARYGGTLLHVARLAESAEGEDAPYEFHLLAFPSKQDLRRFQQSPESRALDPTRHRVIAHAQIVDGEEISLT